MTVPPRTPHDTPRPTDPPSLGGILLSLGVFYGLLTLLVYPVITTAVLGGTLVASLGVRRYLATIVARSQDQHRTLRIPGLGTVEYRITPRQRYGWSRF